MHLWCSCILRVIHLLRGINKALETLTESLHKKAGAVLQDCLSSGCQHLNHHTSPSVNIGLYSSFLTNFLYLLPCGLCLLACSTNTCTLCFSLCPSPWGVGIQDFCFQGYFCPKYFLHFVFTPNPNRYFYFCSSLSTSFLFFRWAELLRADMVAVN